MADDVTGNDFPIHGAFKIDENQVRGHVDHVVRESVEQTLNGLLEAETTISMIKRNHDGYLRARTAVGREMEMMFKIVLHNLMVV